MNSQPTFQSIILALEHFWAEHGCLIWQPYYSQVGAGTMNPGTFLRVLGPEPWHVAYVEPSIRPDDGRFGENPNRFQQHYQYQVILKPDPGNPQELYLQSLEALGLDLRRHDLRFVEDNWESPALGAWGLGWEVWLDGQEITQFTYFQQAGGLECKPVSVELTYGLERIWIALRNAATIWGEPWTGEITYGDVNLKGEYEHSKYYFEVADVARLRQMYDLYDAECRAALGAGLVLPAYDYLLKCSHTFNVLDTRGAVGVTERAGFFGRMRGLAREVAEAYVAQRQQMEFPLIKDEGGRMKGEGRLAVNGQPSAIGTAQPFLLEIGVEELPAADLDAALAQLAELAPGHFDAARLEHGRFDIFGTPRRLVILAHSVAAAQADLEQTIKGPPANRAFDSDGNPTKAAIGFARKNGVPVEALEVREMDGGEYAVAVVRQAGRPAPEALAEMLPALIAAIRFDKSMRWNESDVAFSRPIRGFVALLGDQVIPFEYAGVRSGRTSAGLRRLGPPEIEIPNASAYFDLMAQQGILVKQTERRDAIGKQVAALATEVHGKVDDPGNILLDEVTNLVEMPTALRGTFDDAFLELPQEVLISVMKKHQRYFPVIGGAAGGLLPYFIAVRNGDDEGLDLVRQGNEHVIRARFADARFFVREDLKQPLEAFRAKLATLAFQVNLGSMLDKAERIEKITLALAPRLGLSDDDTRTAVRAAHLCKADLATSMVIEMTALQGVMGREYAVRSGEPPDVARAIFEHYLPRSQGDDLPQTMPGVVVGLADRLDSLAGLFAAGLAPTGSADPFALRRAALGIVQVLLGRQISFSVREGLRLAAEVQPIPGAPEGVDQAAEFVHGRLRAYLVESGLRYDIVDAALAARGDDPLSAQRAAQDLARWVTRPDWPPTLAGYARCVRITRDQTQSFDVKPERLVEPAERELFEAVQAALEKPRATVDEFLQMLLPLIPAISRFFDEVLVMAEDSEVRENRLGVLQTIARLADGVADFSKLEGF